MSGGIDKHTKLLLRGRGVDGHVKKAVTSVEAYDSYTSLMLHMNNNLTDAAKSHVATVVGSITYSTTTKKVGTHAARFSGGGGSPTDYIQYDDHADFHLGTTFTLEAWIYYDSTTPYHGYGGIFSKLNEYGLIIGSDGGGASGQLQFDSASGGIGFCGPNIKDGWHHVAVSSNAGVCNLFLDGKIIGSMTGADCGSGTSSKLWIGLNNTSNNTPFGGWMDDVRISKGISRYDAEFIPPTHSLGTVAHYNQPAASQGFTASEFDTRILCQFNGSKGETAYVAETGQTVTFAGTAQLDTAQKKFGSSSLLLDGNSDYVSIPDTGDFNFGKIDWTVDCQAMFNNLPAEGAEMCLWSKVQSATARIMLVVYTSGGSLYAQFLFYDLSGDAHAVTSSALSLSALTWYHFAVEEIGESFRIYLNGVLVGSASTSETMPNYVAPVEIGRKNEASPDYFDGWIDEFRVTFSIINGYRYDANFAPPIVPYPLNPRPALKFGGGSYLTYADHADWALSTYSFSIEFWVNPFSYNAGAYNHILSQGSTNLWQLYISDSKKVQFEYWEGATPKIQIGVNGTLPLNTWSHIVVARTGTTINDWKIFINGISQSFADGGTYDGSISDISDTLSIGKISSAGAYYFYGLLRGLRIQRGTSAYSSAFVPPENVEADSATVLLLKGEGVHNSTSPIVDAIGDDVSGQLGRLATWAGTAQIDSAQFKFRDSSILLDGDSDYVSFPASGDWAFGLGDFTIDFWVRLAALPSGNQFLIIGQYPDGTHYNICYLDSGSLYFQWRNGGTITSIAAAHTAAINQWIHFALVRASGAFLTFKNGNSISLSENSNPAQELVSISGALNVGGGFANYYLNGWLDEVRISKFARWTSNFTPPTVPYSKFSQKSARLIQW